RVEYIKQLLLHDNFKRLVFLSQAGKETLHSYGGVHDERLLRKVAVVYPAVREVDDSVIRFKAKDILILFSGEFFRKGGVTVVDAFERAQRVYPSIRLRLCCDEKIDFNTRDDGLRTRYLEKIRRNDRMTLGRVSRDELVRSILPDTDIYAMPSYVEVF